MNWADTAILILIALSALISVLRGFVREALSLAGLAAAVWVGLRFGPELGVLLEPHIEVPSARGVAAFVILFVLVLIVGALINHLAGKLVQKSGLSGTDRMIGVLFGVGRGIAIVALLILAAGLTALPQDPWWRESRAIGHIEPVALWLRGLLPTEMSEHFRFPSDPVPLVPLPAPGALPRGPVPLQPS
jgi:membrane protein required for colicin V production